MASSVSPKIAVTISGDNITSFNNTGSFTLENKIEESYTLNSIDSDVVLSFANIENLRIISFYADGEFQVEFSKDSGVNVIAFNMDTTIAPVIIPITSDFLTTLDSITIRTASTEDVQVEVKMYGVVDA